MIRIILIDDHQLVIAGLASILNNEPGIEVVAEANNGSDGLRYIQAMKPDVILLDLDMPVMNGLVVAEKVKKDFPEIKIIILSLHREASIIKHLIKLGVDGYIIKSSAKNELIAAINSVSNGARFFGPEISLALTSPDTDKKSLTPHASQVNLLSSLSDREVEVLKHIAEGLTNKEIGSLLHLSPRTVDAHRASIMKKLDKKNVVGLVKFAMRSGLVE